MHSSHRSSLAFLKGSQVYVGFGLLVVGPLIVGHLMVYCLQSNQYTPFQRNKQYWRFLTSQPARTSQRFVIPSVTSCRWCWPYFCLGFLLSPFCHLLLCLQVVCRMHQASGFLNGKTISATKTRSLLFSSGQGRSCPSELGRTGSHWVAWIGGVFAGLDELAVTILACVCAFLRRYSSRLGACTLSPSRQSISSYGHLH